MTQMAAPVRIVLGAILAGLLLAVVPWLSEIKLGEAPNHSMLRFAWRLTGQRARVCRTLTEAELARMPVHMRRKEECQERNFDYSLKVYVDGKEALSRLVQPAGVHGDRPIYVQEDVFVPAGMYHVQVQFIPLEPPFMTSLDESQKAGIRELMRKAVQFSFDDQVAAEAGRIALLTNDQDTGKLVVAKSRI